MVSTIGTVGEWGIPNAQTGFILDNVEHEYAINERYCLNRQGEEQGVTMFNSRANISISGEVPTATPFSVKLAAAVTLGTALTDFFNGSTGVPSAGNIILFGVTKSHPRGDYQTFRASVRGQPNFV